MILHFRNCDMLSNVTQAHPMMPCILLVTCMEVSVMQAFLLGGIFVVRESEYRAHALGEDLGAAPPQAI